MKILAFATQGTGGNDEERLRALLRNIPHEMLPFDRSTPLAKLKSFLSAWRSIRRTQPGLVVMEGSGIAGGAALLLARFFFDTRYVVSSGDAIAPFVASIVPALSPFFCVYERLLCRSSAGFIGWTPYLSGRALTYGAPRAMHAAGWAPFTLTDPEKERARTQVRDQYGIPSNAIVIGIAGSLAWNSRVGFCYGFDLVRAIRACKRNDIYALIVGDGSGRSKLEQEAGELAGKRVFFTGRVPREEVPRYLSALDVGSLPQSCDRLGSFRYSTKLGEYVAARLPVVTGELPFAYDLSERGRDWIHRIPGDRPWDPQSIRALASWLDSLDAKSVARMSESVPKNPPLFDQENQVERVTSFLKDLIAEA